MQAKERTITVDGHQVTLHFDGRRCWLTVHGRTRVVTCWPVPLAVALTSPGRMRVEIDQAIDEHYLQVLSLHAGRFLLALAAVLVCAGAASLLSGGPWQLTAGCGYLAAWILAARAISLRAPGPRRAPGPGTTPS
jgi:hypothetical protein